MNAHAEHGRHRAEGSLPPWSRPAPAPQASVQEPRWLSQWRAAALAKFLSGERRDPAPQAPRSVADLADSWRGRARRLAARANELGDCRAGLEAFTEACVLRQCADELDGRR